ncbi:MAG: right-handed parallel beta-helix repeat-containing protein [Bacteroidia bacterium]|nr:right-handed parallel beta-helix repeat-containing protein [Bacteroidia bacterium]
MKNLLVICLCAGFALMSFTPAPPSQNPAFAKAKPQATASAAEVEALYTALAEGKAVELKDLIYHLSEPLMISNRTDFTLDGHGCTFIMENKDADVVVVENSFNVTLKNFKATHVEPEGPIGCTGSVLQVRESMNVLIEKCKLNGSGIIGVTTYNTQNLKVVSNYIYNNSKYGVLFDGETSIEIKENIFENNGPSGDSHVVKALNAYLSEVEAIPAGTKRDGIMLSGNVFK